MGAREDSAPPELAQEPSPTDVREGIALPESSQTQPAQDQSLISRKVPNTITLHIAPYSSMIQKPADALEKHTKSPTEFSETIIKDKLASRTPEGIYALYDGYVTATDANGMLVLPRKHLGDTIEIVITTDLYPIIVKGVSPEYFVHERAKDVAYYKLTRIQDAKTKQYSWLTQKTNPPASLVVPQFAIIIFARPHQIIVPEVITTTIPGENLLLPPLYATHTIAHNLNAIWFLRINQYFSPVEFRFQYQKDRYAFMIQP
jgi:hypothetical protein